MNPRKIRTIALLAALTVGALAQPAHAQSTTATPPAATMAADVQPEAGALLQKAVQFMGGEAFTGTRNLREVSVITVFGPDGKPVLQADASSTVDLAGMRMLLTIKVNGTLVAGEALTSEGAFAYSPGSGTVKKPRNLEAQSRESFYKGEYALLRPITQFQSAHVLGTITRHGATGTGVQIKVGDVESLLLLAEDGTLVGYGDVKEGEAFSVYDEYAEVNGVRYASAGRFFDKGALQLAVRITATERNVDMTDADFKLP